MTAEFVLFIAIIKLLSPRRLFNYCSVNYFNGRERVGSTLLKLFSVTREAKHPDGQYTAATHLHISFQTAVPLAHSGALVHTPCTLH